MFKLRLRLWPLVEADAGKGGSTALSPCPDAGAPLSETAPAPDAFCCSRGDSCCCCCCQLPDVGPVGDMAGIAECR